MNAAEKLELSRMGSLNEAIVLDDVWTGKTDRAARKKLQNRLNQRAYKRRRACKSQSAQDCPSVPQSQAPKASQVNVISLYLPETSARARTLPVIPYATMGPVVYFPLPIDNLLTLVQFNVLRAIVTNMRILSMTEHIPFECDAMHSVTSMIKESEVSTIPAPFTFTPLQESTPHEYWIDMFPCGAMRDNLIRATQNSAFDADDFCVDVCGGLFEGYCDVELRGVVAWNDPWSPAGWEVTEGFLQKYGYLLKGCRELLVATNKWRALRGEDELVWEV